MESLYKKLKDYGDSEYYPYHMPGHKRRLFGDMPESFLKMDITEIDGFDNLHDAKGILLELQQKAAFLFSAKESFFLVGGSTAGILTAISAALPRKGHILMARNCHKSAYHGAYLRQLNITYLYPPIMPDFTIYDSISVKQVEEAMDENPDIKAVLIVSPTYEGRICDIQGIAKAVHQRNAVLIVDEAHGAHLGLAEGFAKNSNQAGADLVIQSLHKTLPSPTQTAILHVNTDRVDIERIKRFLHIYQSSSPSYVLMAGIENALQLVESRGKELFADFRKSFLNMMTQLSCCKKLRFLPYQPDRQDIGKLVIVTDHTLLTGQKLYDLLSEKYRLQPEMAADTYCLAMFTIADTKEGYERLTGALLEIDEMLCQNETAPKPADALSAFEGPHIALPLCEAWEREAAWKDLKTAAGSIAGDFVSLYPPGVPLLAPGEVIDRTQIQTLLDYLQKGLNVQGIEQRNSKYYIKCIDAKK